MDWTFWYFAGLAWFALALLWLPPLGAAIVAAWRGQGDKIDGFLSRHGSLIGAIISTGVTAVGVVAAWVAVQSQIDAGNDAARRQITATIETAKLQVAAALETANQQIEEARKEHRLEYLRQYLGQLEPALTWLQRADRQGLRRSLYATDMEPYKSTLRNDLDDEITFMNAMPLMPFYEGTRTRPSDRRDNVVESIKRYQLVLAEPKERETSTQDDRVQKAAEAVREVDKWSDDYLAVSTIEMDAKRELKKLEAEIEYHSKPF